jgi:hypothetical protein
MRNEVAATLQKAKRAEPLIKLWREHRIKTGMIKKIRRTDGLESL